MRQKFLWMGLCCLVFASGAFATITQIDYDAKFGLFGTVGRLHTTLNKRTKRYELETTVRLSGIAKALLKNHRERHISKGHYEKGLMVSDLYQIIQHYSDTVTSKEYRIDHKRKHVIRRYRKWKHGKLVKEQTKTLNFYAKDDLLTLYFNLGKAIQKRGKTYHFKAVGLEKQKGQVRVRVPSASERSTYTKLLGRGAKLYAKALIYQKNFKHKKGDIFLSIAADGYVQKAVMKDILLYGDVKIVRR